MVDACEAINKQENTMNKIIKPNCLWFAFCIGISLGFANLALAGNEGPEGFTYAVHVIPSSGEAGDDCFTFDTNGILKIFWLETPLTFARDALDTDKTDWQAISQLGAVKGIAFHGSISKKGNSISGNAINELGKTFVFKGNRIDNCSLVDGLVVRKVGTTPVEY
jgi:hypothetical protein